MTLKKCTACLLILCAVCLCACGGKPAETTTPTTTPTTVPTEPEVLTPTVELHSGIREDGTFDEGTLFIGDSLTNGMIFDNLMLYDRIGDARYMAIVGAPVQAYFDGPTLYYDLVAIFCEEFYGMTFAQAVESIGREVTAVYFMLGSNYSVYTTYETYEKIVDHLLENCPNATIYLQKIPYSTSGNVHYELVNGILEELQAQYAESLDCRVLLVDTYSAIGDRLVEDGIHLNPQGQDAWYEKLLAFAEENNIPQ